MIPGLVINMSLPYCVDLQDENALRDSLFALLARGFGTCRCDKNPNLVVRPSHSVSSPENFLLSYADPEGTDGWDPLS